MRTGDKVRIDCAGNVVDVIHATDHTTGKTREMTAAQIWVAPGYEDAYHNPDIGTVILALIDRYDAVLWRMKDGTARTFLRDPSTGKLGMSAPTPATPDGQHALGSTAERFWKAEQLLKNRRARAG